MSHEPTEPIPVVSPRESMGERSLSKHEVSSDSPYKDLVDDIKTIHRDYNPKQLESFVYPTKMRELLDQIEGDAKDVRYTRRERDAANPRMVRETVLNFNGLLLEQIDFAISDSDPTNEHPVTAEWDTHLTQQNGFRDTIASLLEDARLRDPFIQAVRTRQAELIRGQDGISGETGSRVDAEKLQRIAQEEGELALESTPVRIVHVEDAARSARAIMTGETQAVTPEKNPKLAKLFSPYLPPVIPTSSISQDQYYDAMVGGSDEELARVKATRAQEEAANEPLRKQRADYERLVNEDTVDYAVQILSNSIRFDATLKTLLADAGFTSVTVDTVRALREDEELRYRVGEYFLQKLTAMVSDDPSSFGERIEANAQKRTDYIAIPGMPATKSREYAAWLALSKVSGMFNYKNETETDNERYDAKGRVNNAQHRHAADQILFSP